MFIEHKRTVKYLGLHIDDRLKYSDHVSITLDAVSKAFFKHKRMFLSSKLNAKVKIICNLLLIRPILTYGCQISFGISPSSMETIRRFKRSCLRACLGVYRDPGTNFERNVSNAKLYNMTGIPRADMFILKFIRDHISKASRSTANPLISLPYTMGLRRFE